MCHCRKNKNVSVDSNVSVEPAVLCREQQAYIDKILPFTTISFISLARNSLAATAAPALAFAPASCGISYGQRAAQASCHAHRCHVHVCVCAHTHTLVGCVCVRERECVCEYLYVCMCM